MSNHSILGRRLFWLEGISDEYPDKIYSHSSAVIIASVGEGFGLPIIEVALHRTSRILRDLPVFREIAKELLSS
jgi:glycogen synthase